ncbi:hypothetical protein KIL84_005136, partial [Mauremys mutica]
GFTQELQLESEAVEVAGSAAQAGRGCSWCERSLGPGGSAERSEAGARQAGERVGGADQGAGTEGSPAASGAVKESGSCRVGAAGRGRLPGALANAMCQGNGPLPTELSQQTLAAVATWHKEPQPLAWGTCDRRAPAAWPPLGPSPN